MEKLEVMSHSWHACRTDHCGLLAEIKSGKVVTPFLDSGPRKLISYVLKKIIE